MGIYRTSRFNLDRVTYRFLNHQRPHAPCAAQEHAIIPALGGSTSICRSMASTCPSGDDGDAGTTSGGRSVGAHPARGWIVTILRPGGGGVRRERRPLRLHRFHAGLGKPTNPSPWAWPAPAWPPRFSQSCWPARCRTRPWMLPKLLFQVPRVLFWRSVSASEITAGRRRCLGGYAHPLRSARPSSGLRVTPPRHGGEEVRG